MSTVIQGSAEVIIVVGLLASVVGAWFVFRLAAPSVTGEGVVPDAIGAPDRASAVRSPMIVTGAGLSGALLVAAWTVNSRVVDLPAFSMLLGLTLSAFALQLAAGRVSLFVRIGILAMTILVGVGVLMSTRLGAPPPVHILGAAIVAFAIGARASVLRFLLHPKAIPVVGVAALVMIASPLVIGLTAADGARIELALPGLGHVQPQEAGRVLLVIWLGASFAYRRPQLLTTTQRWRGIPIPDLGLILVTAGPAGMAIIFGLASDDLGPATLLAFVVAAMLAVVGAKPRYLITGFLSAGIGAAAVALIHSKVERRISLMLEPIPPAPGPLHQISEGQALIAHGGLDGLGLGNSLPRLVPLIRSDYLVAAISGELGMLILLALLSLGLLIFFVCTQVSRRSTTDVHAMVSLGLGSLLCFPMLLVTAGIFALFPHSGMVIPFLSTSGSSLVSSAFALGLITAISKLPAGDIAPAVQRRTRAVGSIVLVLFGIVSAQGIAIATGFANTLETIGPERDRYSQYVALLDRGTITTRDGVVLAHTTTADPDERFRLQTAIRAYPEGDAYAAIVGHASLGGYGSGLERALRHDLRCGSPREFTYGDCPTIKLTIDSRIQQTAIDAMGAYAGAVMAVDLETGAVLAYVSTSGSSDGTTVPDDAYVDRVARETAVPGSVIKLGTGIAGLQQDIPLLHAPVASYEVEGASIRSVDRAPCGGTSFANSIAISCNPEFAYIGAELGAQRLSRLTDGLYNQQNSLNQIAVTPTHLVMSDEDKHGAALSGIGQGSARATVLSVTQLTALIARDGDPLPFTAVQGRKGELSTSPQVDLNSVATIQEGMEDAVRYGTAAGIDGLVALNTAAKTGTAEVADGSTNAWITTYAPYDSPRCAVTVLAQQPDGESGALWGGRTAGPIAAAVLEACEEWR